MSNNDTLADVEGRGLCPPPFLDASKFTGEVGYIEGRMCSQVFPGLKCCIPCPATDWIYPSSFKTWYRVAQGLGVLGLFLCLFLLFTYAILPVEKSKRQYMNVCLVLGITLLELAFVIPLFTRPKNCADAITPHDLTSDIGCGFSGAAIVLGGLVTTVWITFRSFSMHLQICWDVIPGKKIFWSSLGFGWGITVLFFVLTMIFTGVSYRFGDTCHLNAHQSVGHFWAPLLVLAGIAGFFQFATLFYCLKVYMASVFTDEPSNTNMTGGGVPSTSGGSNKKRSTKAVYQRVKKVIWLQWRSMTILACLLVDIIFLSVVWIQLDSSINHLNAGHAESLAPFLRCLMMNPGVNQRGKCMDLAQKAFVRTEISTIVIMLLAISGIQTGLLNIRTSMFTGWKEFFQRGFKKETFTSIDAKRFSAGGGGEIYQMNRMTPDHTSANKAPSETFSSKEDSPYLNQQSYERNYKQPTMSFSAPRPASSAGGRPGWDATESYAPSMPSIEAIKYNKPRDDHV